MKDRTRLYITIAAAVTAYLIGGYGVVVGGLALLDWLGRTVLTTWIYAIALVAYVLGGFVLLFNEIDWRIR